MTTLVGIHAKKGIEGIVIAADTQYTAETARGRVITRGPKIYRPHTGIINWVYAASGDACDAFNRFRRSMLRKRVTGIRTGDAYIEDALERWCGGAPCHFPEVRDMNDAARKENPIDCNPINLVIGYRNGNLWMFHVNSRGTINMLGAHETIAVGSGRKYAQRFLDMYISTATTLNDAERLARGAILNASMSDDATSGFNRYILTKKPYRNVVAYFYAHMKDIRVA